MCPTGTSFSNATKTAPKSNLRSAFDVLDVDGDGRISYDDLRSFNGEFSALEDDFIGPMIDVADADRNGYVEYEEFEKVLDGKEKNKKGMVRDGRIGVMEEAFRVMDKDGDGKVGLEDLRSYLNWAGIEAHDEDVKAMIRLGCGDVNGGVDFEGLMKILSF